jgi:hypothetical protein
VLVTSDRLGSSSYDWPHPLEVGVAIPATTFNPLDNDGKVKYLSSSSSKTAQRRRMVTAAWQPLLSPSSTAASAGMLFCNVALQIVTGHGCIGRNMALPAH